MSRARLAAAIAGLIEVGLAGCGRLPKDSVYLDLAHTPPTVRAALVLEYNPAGVGSVVRYHRHGQAVYRVILIGDGQRRAWVEFNPAGDQIGHGFVG